MRRLLLLTLSVLLFANWGYPQIDSLDYFRNQARYCFSCHNYFDAKKSYMNLYSIVGSQMEFEDLKDFFFSAEKSHDTLLSKKLLFDIVNSNRFERRVLNKVLTSEFEMRNRTYWKSIDSIICLREREQEKYRPYIDSIAIMCKDDLEIRSRAPSEEQWRQIAAVDSANTAKLKRLIAQYGFPTWSLVGYAASAQAWQIAQHSNPAFLGEFLKLYRKAVKENDAEKSKLALMEDRHRMNEGRPQLYGSQLFGLNAFFPIANIHGVDERRQAMELEPIKEYAKKFNLDTIVVADFFLDYHYYYVNLNTAFEAYSEGDYPKAISSFGTLHYPFPRDLKLLCDAYLANNDTLKAVATAKKMVLCGYRLKENTLLDGFLRDSVASEYEALVEEYHLQLDDKANALFDSTQSFHEIKELLDTKHYPRYSVDAWNNHIPNMIRKHAGQVSENDYIEFFNWLYGQVIIGNYHLFDYASMYDEVHHRLFGCLYFGQLLLDSVSIYQEDDVSERRSSINLPDLNIWHQLRMSRFRFD